MDETRDRQLAAVRDDPAAAAVLLDFDGTLSPVVDDPASARPIEGAVPVLERLAEVYETVAVVSGRPLSFLTSVLPPVLDLVGLYGLEGLEGGVRWEHPTGGVWREVIADVATLARSQGPAGMLVEPKDLSITFHYRSNPELGAAVAAFAEAQAERAGLRARPARMSVELHPPVDTDKGVVVERLAAEAKAAIFIGDDVGDLAAFDALDRLGAAGHQVVRVAVRSEEVSDELLRRADLVIDGPPDVLRLLRSLLPTT